MKKVFLLLLLSGLSVVQAKVLVRQQGNDIEIEFQYADAKAGGVVVAGDFNQWSLSSAVMVKGLDDVWRYVLKGVKPSDVLQYKYVLGTRQQWILDPEAPDTVSDNKGGKNGQVVVKQFLRTVIEDVPTDIGKAGEILVTPAELPATAVKLPTDGSRNLLVEPGFENGGLNGWTLRGDVDGLSVERNPANAHSGDNAFKYMNHRPFKFLMLKRLTGLKPGNYSFKVWAAGGGGEAAVKVFARDCGVPQPTVSIANTGWQQWRQYVVRGLSAEKGECTIGLYVNGFAGNWGSIDDLEFVDETTWTKIKLEPAR
nr:glycogen-binding domain-containing protein [uncultured Rhodoferax sp.]